MRILSKRIVFPWLLAVLVLLAFSGAAAEETPYAPVTGEACATCHAEAAHDGSLASSLHLSVHAGFDCLMCHQDKDSIPHRPTPGFRAGDQGCRSMNPCWLTGTMPEDMYRASQPGDLDRARAETEDYLQHASEVIHGGEDE